MSSANWRPFCHGLDMLNWHQHCEYHPFRFMCNSLIKLTLIWRLLDVQWCANDIRLEYTSTKYQSTRLGFPWMATRDIQLASSYLAWGQIWSTCVLPFPHDDINNKYSFTFQLNNSAQTELTHWDRVTHICVGNLTIIGSDNGLSPGRRQAIIWTIGMLLTGSLGTNFSEILIGIQTFSFKKMHLKMSSAKWRPSCLGLNVLM